MLPILIVLFPQKGIAIGKLYDTFTWTILCSPVAGLSGLLQPLGVVPQEVRVVALKVYQVVEVVRLCAYGYPRPWTYAWMSPLSCFCWALPR